VKYLVRGLLAIGFISGVSLAVSTNTFFTNSGLGAIALASGLLLKIDTKGSTDTINDELLLKSKRQIATTLSLCIIGIAGLFANLYVNQGDGALVFAHISVIMCVFVCQLGDMVHARMKSRFRANQE
jgi:hypothetical protein